MFYRFTPDGRRKAIDLGELYSGALFLCGGHPSLRDEPLELLSRPGIATMAMNNTALLVRPQLWVCADAPSCYAKAILQDPGILKFVRLLYSEDPIAEGEGLWREQPSTFFIGVDEMIFHSGNLLDDYGVFAWWKNVFILSLQIAYHLGFRKIYLAGTGFTVPGGRHYAFDHALTDEQSKYSQRTYDDVVSQLRAALPHFEARGLSLVSCTPGSLANEFLPFVPFRDAVEEALQGFPQRNADGLRHASDFVDK